METVLKKWGNSLAVRIPKKILEKSNFHDGQLIFLEKKKDGIFLRKKEDNLNFFLEKINEENIHNEVDFGKIKGNEIW